ncbi:2-polyprenyl-3-methyl-6-methoxy-1,4-benzoquinone monooxygenase [Alcanivorax sp.]|uniref:2-polyprenyl-3-methyl-6-methoxy-1,4-benzoquinone monooxygenase n=1 Tax=Alcanivorax sp. TaxID=1872427 RepID=UPI000C501469|nr:2-polyprenyl-3-methyl-6-methoxy-1,4-benzoquinone monooxygenase [Alcanivorax sp.]MBQ25295.1 demethoxyubiquinone hydroxylase family protein [Alcanivorax sp.]
MTERRLSPLDRLLARADNALRTLTPGTVQAERSPTSSPTGPGSDIQPGTLPGDQRRHVLGLMRINHTGEVCAQALYQGQASTASLPHIRHAMEESAREEEDHLAWCEERIQELGGGPSKLNPLFYAMSYAVGATAGLIGDRWSLGFVTETENQVVKHLESHLYQVPESDLRTRAILEQMKTDELKHAVTAKDAGGADLPLPVRHAMTLMSKVMTFTTYRI